MDESQAPESAGEPKKKDLYHRHVEDFIATARKDLKQALDRFGFTVWHSLPPDQAALVKEKLGVQPVEAVDLYNRGTSRARQGDYKAAEADLRAALQKDPRHALAAFNLAVCLEKSNRLSEARQAYEHYIEILDRARGRTDLLSVLDVDVAEEKARVRQHLDELGRA